MTCSCGNGSTEINSANCGSTPCGCSQTLVPCGTVQGCTNSCGCQSSCNSANPAPYYSQACGVQESHCMPVVQQQYVTGLTISSTFNMPACDGTAVITIPGLQKIVIGSYLWNPVYGYLKVVSFDYLNGQVTVENECQSNNAAPGTAIPACTLFTVVDTPCCGSGVSGPCNLYPYVAVDFTAPANGDCVTITVTNVNGLVAGKNVQIGGAVYYLDAIVSSTLITICNQGSGLPVGTVVVAYDSEGNCISPVILMDTSPCNNTAVIQGSIVVCHDGLTQPLDATMVGQVPVVVNATTNEVQYQMLDIPVRQCTFLTSCLNLLIGVDTYTLVVDDSSIFNIGDILQIDSRTDRYTITDIPDGTHIEVTVSPVPGANEEIAIDTSVCWAGCCEQLASDINDWQTHPCDWDLSDRFFVYTDADIGASEHNGTILVMEGTEEVSTTPVGFTFTNNSCKIEYIIVMEEHIGEGEFKAQDEDWAQMRLKCYYDVTSGAGTAPAPDPASNCYSLGEQEIAFNRSSLTGDPPALTHSIHQSFSRNKTRVYALTPGFECKISAFCTLKMGNSATGVEYEIGEVRSEIYVYRVSF